MIRQYFYVQKKQAVTMTVVKNCPFGKKTEAI